MTRRVWFFFLFPLAGCAVGAALWFSPFSGWVQQFFDTRLTEAIGGFGISPGGSIFLRFFERTEAAVFLQQTLTGLIGGYLITVLIVFTRPAVGWPVGFIGTGIVLGGAWYISFLTGTFSAGQIPAAAFLATYLLSATVRSGQKLKIKRFFRDLFAERIPPKGLARMIRNPRRAATGVRRARLTLISCGAEFPVRPAAGKEEPSAVDTTVSTTYICRRFASTIINEEGMAYAAGQRRVDGCFGVPVLPGTEGDTVERGVRAALACIEGEGSAARELRVEYGVVDPPRFSAGIYTGETAVGYTGQRRLLGYRPLGSDAELSKKLLGLNEEYGTRILACENTVRNLSGSAGARPLDRVREEGNSFRIYEVLTLEEHRENAETFALFTEALGLFEKKRWAEAHAKFLEVLKRRKGDGPAALYAKRCQKYVKTPPPAGWDGIFMLPSRGD